MRRIRVVVVSMCLLFGAAVTASAQCAAYGANPNDGIGDGQALQNCFDNNSYVYLDRGNPGYLIDMQIMVKNNIRLITTSGPDKAILKAHQTLTRPILHFEGDAHDYVLSELIFDGDKYNRLDDSGCTNDNYAWEGSNILARGSNYTIHHIDTVNAQCGTGLELVGNNISVYSVYSAYNGFSADEAQGKFADGITVLRCTGGSIHDNGVYENTDVGIAIFGGTNCFVQWNDIANYQRYAFAGITLNDKNTNNSFFGGQIGSNWITSGYEKMSTGFYIGGHPSPYVITNSGEILNNRIEGAVVNLWIEGIDDGYVSGNSLLNPQGSRQNLCPGASGNYFANHVGSANIQGGWTPFSVHSCS